MGLAIVTLVTVVWFYGVLRKLFFRSLALLLGLLIPPLKLVQEVWWFLDPSLRRTM